MSIQVSVIIWTVICFLLLMVILKNLLFKPVFKVMDERKQKIEEAQLKKEAVARLVEENRENVARQKAEYIKKREAEKKAAAEKLYTEGKLQLEAAQKLRLKNADAYREKMETELDQIVSAVGSQMENTAELFAQKIVNHRI